MEAISEKKERLHTEREQALGENIFRIASGVWRMKDIFVNVYIIENLNSRSWVLVDTGMKSAAPKIRRMVKAVTDPKSKPVAIILTHGHFDHRGSVKELAEEWKVPIYAHRLEMPYLSGLASYPPADPSVEGGMMASLSFLYPRKPIDLQGYLQDLPLDNHVDFLPDWQWIHTPGHSPGHISLFRPKDALLIAGDALVTTRQESVISVAMQRKEFCGPPRYFTPDWNSAARSVKKLAALKPQIIATGHGRSFYGKEAEIGLLNLVKNFAEKEVPQHGRYVHNPATFDEEGPLYIPKDHTGYWRRVAALGLGIAAGFILYKKFKGSNS